MYILCQRLATAATFLRQALCCPEAMTRRWALQTRYTHQCNTNIIKDLIFYIAFVLYLNLCYNLSKNCCYYRSLGNFAF